MLLEKTLESPFDCKEIQPVHPRGDLSWVFIGRTDVEAETPILWPRDVKSWLIGKAPDAGRDWGQEEKETTEDEMVGWHHRLNGHEFEWTPGVGDGQGSLACCSLWGCKESDMTELSRMIGIIVVRIDLGLKALSLRSVLNALWIKELLYLSSYYFDCPEMFNTLVLIISTERILNILTLFVFL